MHKLLVKIRALWNYLNPIAIKSTSKYTVISEAVQKNALWNIPFQGWSTTKASNFIYQFAADGTYSMRFVIDAAMPFGCCKIVVRQEMGTYVVRHNIILLTPKKQEEFTCDNWRNSYQVRSGSLNSYYLVWENPQILPSKTLKISYFSETTNVISLL
jgi:hypothetical protein